MNRFCLLLILAVYLAAVNGRYADSEAGSEAEVEDTPRGPSDHYHSPNRRHQRKPRQSIRDYSYPLPWYPFQVEERRDKPDLLPQIVRLLDDISTYIRHPMYAPPPPPQPPQPIYVPYPVPYPVPESCKCPSLNDTPSFIGSRINIPMTSTTTPEPERIWSFGYYGNPKSEEGTDGSRPINLDNIRRPGQPLPPAVNTQNPILDEIGPDRSPAPGTRKPNKLCEVTAMVCCFTSKSEVERNDCFTHFGCIKTYSRGKICEKDNLMELIDSYYK